MFSTTIKTTVYKLFILTAVLAIALSINFIYAAWTGPTQAPPEGNTSTPVNVGVVNQVKDAGLGLNALSVFGNSYFAETVGIQTTEPSTGGEQDLILDVEGAVGAQFYCDEDGNNCFNAAQVRDSVDGNRVWQATDKGMGVTYQNTVNHDVHVSITFSSPGQGDNFCRFVLESGSTSDTFVTIGAVDGRIGGRWKNELWGLSAPIPSGSFYRVRAVEAHEDCNNTWIQTWAELK